MDIHVFTLSGLGEAPFKVIAPPKEDSCVLTATSETFFCEHCGTMLKNRHFIKSSDNKTSVVGIDCLKKTGDEGLIAGHKRLVKEAAFAQREAQIEQNRILHESVQRERLGGKTIAELKDCYAEIISEYKRHLESELRESYVGKVLAQSNFGQNMLIRAELMDHFTDNMVSAMTSIVVKAVSNGARKNSAAYNAALPVAESHVKAFFECLESRKELIDSLNSEFSSRSRRVNKLAEYIVKKSLAT